MMCCEEQDLDEIRETYYQGGKMNSVTPDDAIRYLNELIEIDRPAMAALIANRVPCNQAMADHPTVQVRAQHGGFTVGMVGILNGMFGIDEDGFGPIVWIFKDGDLTGVSCNPGGVR